MPLDAQGNFYPIFPGMPAFAADTSSEVLQGTGPPDNSLGNNGNLYVNVTNGDVYSKSGDVWTILIAGTGGTEIIVGVVDDPNGVHTPADTTKPALYFRDSAGNDNIQMWRWSVADQEWKATIVT